MRAFEIACTEVQLLLRMVPPVRGAVDRMPAQHLHAPLPSPETIPPLLLAMMEGGAEHGSPLIILPHIL
jgi:hypothetical protein